MNVDGRRRPKRGVRILAWLVFLVVLVSFITSLFSGDVPGWELAWGVSFFSFPAVGLFLAVRFPTNAVGWLFLVGPGATWAGFAAMRYGEGTDSASFVSGGELLYIIGLFCLFASLLLFPDGRYPNKWFRRAHAGVLLVVVISAVVLPEGSDVTAAAAIANFLLPMAALVFRAIAGSATVRRQLAGPALVTVFGGAIFGIVWFLPMRGVDQGSWITVLVFAILSVGIPGSIALSVTKYRLYEIDRIVSRTVSYAVVVGFLAVVFFGVVTALTSLLPAESDLAVAGSTLAVATLFNPVRRRVQAGVDRRFNRSRYDAQRVMDGFAGSLRDRVDADGVVEGWVGAVSETMQPSSVGVWVREVHS